MQVEDTTWNRLRMRGIRPWLIGLGVLIIVAAWLGLRSWQVESGVADCRQRYANALSATDSAAVDAISVGEPNPRLARDQTTCGLLRRMGKL